MIDPIRLCEEGGKGNAESNGEEPDDPIAGCRSLKVIPVFKGDGYDRRRHDGNSKTQKKQKELHVAR